MPNRLLGRASQNLSKIMFENYVSAHQQAAQGKFVIWTAIIVPLEILKGFDVVVAVPENHSAMCAAKGVGSSLCETAEASGYSIDLCSYARIDLGSSLGGGKGSPSGGLPKPHLMVSDNNNCSLLVKWFDVYRRKLNIPHFILDVPFCYEPQQPKDLKYIVDQYHDLIRTVEGLTGQKFDYDKCRQAVEYNYEAGKVWKEFLALAANRPAGITAFDTFAHMAPFITSLRGTPELLDHVKLLLAEAKEQQTRGQAPVPGEKYRLLWDNIAPWHQLRAMSSRLAGLEASIISATYTACLGSVEGEVNSFEWDGRDPLWLLGRTQNFSVCPAGLRVRMGVLKELIRRYEIDGVVFSSNRSCKVYSVMQMDLQRRVQEQCGVPTVMIEMDHADQRKYNEDNTFLRLEALLESIDGSRAA